MFTHAQLRVHVMSLEQRSSVLSGMYPKAICIVFQYENCRQKFGRFLTCVLNTTFLQISWGSAAVKMERLLFPGQSAGAQKAR